MISKCVCVCVEWVILGCELYGISKETPSEISHMSLMIQVSGSLHLLECLVCLSHCRHFISVYEIRTERDGEREETKSVALLGLRFPG